jgi:hypothetical protein
VSAAQTNGGQVNGSCGEEDKDSGRKNLEEDILSNSLANALDAEDSRDSGAPVKDGPDAPGGEVRDSGKEPADGRDEDYAGNERIIFNADGDACYQGWGESCGLLPLLLLLPLSPRGGGLAVSLGSRLWLNFGLSNLRSKGRAELV